MDNNHNIIFDDSVPKLVVGKGPSVDLTSLTREEVTLTFENVYINLALLESIVAPRDAKPEKLEYEIPIMIQARWHKKKRINKKWLKRYGMKPDVVKATMNIRECTYEPEHIINKDNTGAHSTYDSWNFETGMPVYEYRPDQMRRNLKIQW